MIFAARYGARDLERAKTFYDAIAPLVGATRFVERPDLIGYRGAEGGMLVIGIPLDGEQSVGNGVQVSFSAPNRKAVDAVYAKALELGGRCEGPPGERSAGFYAAYFRDLDGNKLMVSRMGPAD